MATKEKTTEYKLLRGRRKSMRKAEKTRSDYEELVEQGLTKVKRDGYYGLGVREWAKENGPSVIKKAIKKNATSAKDRMFKQTHKAGMYSQLVRRERAKDLGLNDVAIDSSRRFGHQQSLYETHKAKEKAKKEVPIKVRRSARADIANLP